MQKRATEGVIRGLIFDAGSTLLTFEGDREQALAQATFQLVNYFLEENLPLDPTLFHAAFMDRISKESKRREHDHRERPSSFLLEDELAAFGLQDVPSDIIEGGLLAFYKVIERFWKPLPGLRKTLSQLHREGYRIGLVSNAADGSHVRRLMDAAGIRSFFDPLVVSADIGYRKPSPEPFQVVLEAWELAPDEVVMIGDSLEHDVLGANQVGMRTIWFRGGRSTAGEDEDSGQLRPDRVAEQLSQLPGLLRQMSIGDR